jgi:peptidoglycan hydrolase CwlO-like protein
MGKGLTVIVKNQHLLGGLVVLGAVNVLAFIGMMSGERDSARTIRGLEYQLNGAREEQKQVAERLSRETEELKGQLQEAYSTINQLQVDIGKLQNQLNRTRRALDAIEERLEKPATKEGGGKE